MSSAFGEFLVGANLPWFSYGLDFGSSAWTPDGGIGRDAARDGLDEQLGRLEQTGVRALRWFLFCDGRAGIRFDDDGSPLGLDDSVYRDIEAALGAARRSRLQVLFVLLDFHWCKPRREFNGVQLGGRTQVLQQHRSALLDRVLLPIFSRYATTAEILGWDLMNEPEWVISKSVRAYLKEAATLAHACASQPVTVGSASARWRRLYRHLDLDFYQVHWYSALESAGALPMPPHTLGFDKPVVLGEFATRNAVHAPADILKIAREAGYAGAFYWSAHADDRHSDRAAGQAATLSFSADRRY
jgi:hypothetical protein